LDLEKFKEWIDPVADLPEDAVDINHLLSNISLYWLTRSAESSANLYYEMFSRSERLGSQETRNGTNRRGGFSFPGYRHSPPGRTDHNVAHWSGFARGGHFMAMEASDLLVADIQAFFRTLRGSRS
jgi:hypothetical protein